MIATRRLKEIEKPTLRNADFAVLEAVAPAATHSARGSRMRA
jgi:hypothetical protein